MLGPDDGRHVIHSGVQGTAAIDYHIVKIGDTGQLLACGLQATLQCFLRLGTSLAKASDQFLFCFADEKDSDSCWEQSFDRVSTLNIYPQYYILPGLEGPADVVFRDAFVLLVDAGMLQERTLGDHPLKFVRTVKVIVVALNLVGPGGTIGGGDDKVEWESPLLHPLDDRIFANARWARDDDQQWGLLAVEWIYSLRSRFHLFRLVRSVTLIQSLFAV